MKKVLIAFCTTLVIISCTKKNEKNVTPSSFAGTWNQYDTIRSLTTSTAVVSVSKFDDNTIMLMNFPTPGIDYTISSKVGLDTIIVGGKNSTSQRNVSTNNLHIKIVSTSKFTYTYHKFIGATDENYRGALVKR